MMVFVLVVVIAALILGIVGILVHGLFSLLVIGVILLIADLAFLAVRATRRERPLR
ncbi:hypothetical protein [Actinomadura harenae]|uniref:hypothetical protein n=1 Tax=Actinomadura harenae TaxID=2483351 RepID=UPI0013156B81|nr:hypothetical protein [Actinomadura harenae]